MTSLARNTYIISIRFALFGDSHRLILIHALHLERVLVLLNQGFVDLDRIVYVRIGSFTLGSRPWIQWQWPQARRACRRRHCGQESGGAYH